MTTQEILQQCKVDGLIVRLPDIKLERDEYLQVKKKLELIGGKWKGGKTQGFVFEQDPTELLSDVANGDDRNLKKEFQFFATPGPVADMMTAYLPATLPDGYKILEPSAGDGALIKALRRYYDFDVEVDCFELMELNRKKLKLIDGVKILSPDDFIEAVEDDQRRLKELGNTSVALLSSYDIVLANPPFTKNQDIDHIRKMFEVCKPGGIIVTLSSPSWTFGSQKKQIEFREWLESLGAEKNEIDEGEFKNSGTTIRTVLLVIKKPIVEENIIATPETLPSEKNSETYSTQAEDKNENYFTDAELTEFKNNINKKLDGAVKELEYLKSFTVSGEDENRVFLPDKKDGDTGFEKKHIDEMIQRQQNFIGNLYEALSRIENKTYGICRVTGKLIEKDRLLKVPHATLSLEAKIGANKNAPEVPVIEVPKKEKKKRTAKNEKESEKVSDLKYSDDDLRNFKTLISNKIDSANEEIKYLQVVLMDRNRGIKVEDYEDTSPEEVEALIDKQKSYINQLEDALERIKKKTYGVCEATGALIPKQVLLELPVIKRMCPTPEHPSSVIENNSQIKTPRKCRVCGCTEDNCQQCIEKTGEPCHWVENDLCSACVPEVNDTAELQTEPAITDIEPLSGSVEDENLIIDSTNKIELSEAEKAHLAELENNNSSNDNDMNFFQQLAQAGAQNVDITMRIMQKDGKLTVGIMPGLKSATLKPVNVTGTPSELDAEFFKSIMPGVVEIKSIVTNLQEVKKEAEKTKPSPPSTSGSHKPAAKKPEKKAAVKKEQKKKEEKKKEVKEEKVADPEPNMFG